MKKLLAILLSLSMVLAFTGCQTKEPEVTSERVAEDFVCVDICAHEDVEVRIENPYDRKEEPYEQRI